MSLNNFSGETYVAFSDLNGFKEMTRNLDTAGKALDKLYQTVYELKSKHEFSNLQTLAVSDCTITFASNTHNIAELPTMLRFLKELHSEMIKADYLITSSVAYGPFSYQERIVLTGLDKNMLYGDAYLKAYLNNAKCPEGSIVIICEGNEKDNILQSSGTYREFLKDNRRGVRGLQFFWALSSTADINKFEEAYQDTYRLKYKGMISVYKEYSKQ
jgi:hypothetical protein